MLLTPEAIKLVLLRIVDEPVASAMGDAHARNVAANRGVGETRLLNGCIDCEWLADVLPNAVGEVCKIGSRIYASTDKDVRRFGKGRVESGKWRKRLVHV